MTASKVLCEIVDDVTECPICTEVIVDSKVLPCIHTFCLKCLEQFWKDEKPGKEVPCPLCRTPFNIPHGGLTDLPKNYFVERLLLEVQKLQDTSPSILVCDICSNLKTGTDQVSPPAVNYCVDCESKMCEQCSRIHLVVKSSKRHQVVELGEFQTKLESPVKQVMKRCDVHVDKTMELFCLECKSAVCTNCFIIKHNGHGCSDMNSVVDDLKKQIVIDREETSELVSVVKNRLVEMEHVLKLFAGKVNKAESEILLRGKEMKELVDGCVQSLLQELNDQKTKTMKELENMKEELFLQKISLESFVKYSRDVLDKAIPTDIAVLYADLNTRANKLRKLEIVRIEEPVYLKFEPTDLRTFTGSDSGRNMIGSLSTTTVESNLHSILDSGTTICQRNIPPTSMSNLESVIGVTVSDTEIFVITQFERQIKVFDGETLQHTRNISASELSCPWDICFSQNILFIGEYSAKLVHSIPLSPDSLKSKWSVDSEMLSLSTMSSDNILVTGYSTNRLQEYTTTGQLVREILLQDVNNPCHSVQISGKDQFLVSHAGDSHRVCLINNKGQLLRSYGTSSGSGSGQLYNPYHLAADVNGFGLVVEHGGSNRVVLLNDKLEFLKEVVPTSFELENPIRLCLDRNRKRLFVADFKKSRVVCLDLIND